MHWKKILIDLNYSLSTKGINLNLAKINSLQQLTLKKKNFFHTVFSVSVYTKITETDKSRLSAPLIRKVYKNKQEKHTEVYSPQGGDINSPLTYFYPRPGLNPHLSVRHCVGCFSVVSRGHAGWCLATVFPTGAPSSSRTILFLSLWFYISLSLYFAYELNFTVESSIIYWMLTC